MTKETPFDLPALLDTAIRKNPTVFRTQDGQVHDRKQTVSASRLWTCARRTWAELHDQRVDPGWEDNFGFFERGHAGEDRIVYRLHQALVGTGWRLKASGEGQRTLVSGILSGTPDGYLLPEIPSPKTAPLKFADDLTGEDVRISHGCGLEIKTVDPRLNVQRPKPEHIAQANLQSCLFREVGGEPDCEGVLLIYTDASDFSKRRWFWVPHDETFLWKAERRAEMILQASKMEELLPEGSYDNSCRYCPYTEKCGAASLRMVPAEIKPLANERQQLKLDHKVRQHAQLKAGEDEVKKQRDIVADEIRQLLSENGTRQAAADVNKVVSIFASAGQRRMNRDAILDAFPEIQDDDSFWVVGKPSVHLKITEKET